LIKPLPPAVAAMLDAAADRWGVPRALARGIAWAESQGNPLARSPKGAIGVMQLMPATAASLGVDPNDPPQNIDGGVRYFAMLLAKYGGDVARALAGYVWGPGNVDRHATWPTHVIEYVARVNTRAGLEGGHTVATPFTEGAHLSPSESLPLSSSPRSHGGEDNDT
jgi:soluble lytic murein transglycosylase-like protein